MQILSWAVRSVIALAALIVAVMLTTAAFNAWVPAPSSYDVEGKRQIAWAIFYIVEAGTGFAAARLAWRWL